MVLRHVRQANKTPNIGGAFEQQQLRKTHCEVMYPGIILHYK